MEDALGANFDADADLEQSVAALRARIACEHLLVTLGAKGMLLSDDDGIARVAYVCPQGRRRVRCRRHRHRHPDRRHT